MYYYSIRKKEVAVVLPTNKENEEMISGPKFLRSNLAQYPLQGAIRVGLHDDFEFKSAESYAKLLAKGYDIEMEAIDQVAVGLMRPSSIFHVFGEVIKKDPMSGKVLSKEEVHYFFTQQDDDILVFYLSGDEVDWLGLITERPGGKIPGGKRRR